MTPIGLQKSLIEDYILLTQTAQNLWKILFHILSTYCTKSYMQNHNGESSNIDMSPNT